MMGLMMMDEGMVREGVDAARVVGMQESSMISVCEAARAVTNEAIVQAGDVISSCSSLPITPERMTVHYEMDGAIYYKLLSHTVPGYGLALERNGRVSAFREQDGPDGPWVFLGKTDDRWPDVSIPLLCYEGRDKLVIACVSKFSDDTDAEQDIAAARAFTKPFLSPDGNLAIAHGSLRVVAFAVDGSGEVTYPVTGTAASDYAISAARTEDGALKLLVYTSQVTKPRESFRERLIDRIFDETRSGRKRKSTHEKVTDLPEGLSVADVEGAVSFMPVPITSNGHIAEVIATLDAGFSTDADKA